MWKDVKSRLFNNQESPPLLKNESKASYDVVGLDTDSDDAEKTQEDDSEPSPITRKIIIELLVCIVAFIGRGLCLNSVGPTLIDLRQIAGMTVPQSAFIFVSQSIGFFAGSILAKIILQRMNNELALGMCLSLQAFCTAFIPAFRSQFFMCLMFTGQGFAIGVVGIGVCSTCIRLGGKARNGMFLQSVYLGVSIGSVLGPFIARPFLSRWAKHTDNHQVPSPGNFGSYFEHQTTSNSNFDRLLPTTAFSSAMISNSTSMYNNTTPASTLNEEFTRTHVHFYYVIMGIILSVPAFAFFFLFIKRDNSAQHTKEDNSSQDSLSLSDCTTPLTMAISLMFMQCLLYFGIQDTYSNLLTTFAVLGPLHMPKTTGVYLTSAFWASMCFGRLNGIWIAKLLSPFKMLVIDLTIAGISSIALMLFAGKSTGVLWGFSVLLGLSFATVNGATVSWAAGHLPGNNYILSIIMVGRCAGLLILPTTVTALFKATGPMTLMYTLFFAIACMLASLIIAQTVARRHGINDKLYSKSDMQRLTADD